MSRCLSEDHISAVVSSPHDDDPLQSCSGLFPDLGDSKADRLGFDCVYRGLKTLRHDLTLDRGVSFQAASRKSMCGQVHGALQVCTFIGAGRADWLEFGVHNGSFTNRQVALIVR